MKQKATLTGMLATAGVSPAVVVWEAVVWEPDASRDFKVSKRDAPGGVGGVLFAFFLGRDSEEEKASREDEKDDIERERGRNRGSKGRKEEYAGRKWFEIVYKL